MWFLARQRQTLEPATSGLSREVDGQVVHVFARAPMGNPAVPWRDQGGTDEDLRRVLDADDLDPTFELAVLIRDEVSSSVRATEGNGPGA